MKTIEQNFSVPYRYRVFFTEGLFGKHNTILPQVLAQDHSTGPCKVIVVADAGVTEAHPQLLQQIKAYVAGNPSVLQLVTEPLVIPGGEEAKNKTTHLLSILNAVNDFGVCRHSYVLAIGGGALLDLVGFAASIAHRGIRLIRIPTTVLSQNDSGVGVKNSVNAFNKKNFLGTFSPPFAVINDSDFLLTLEDRDWRSGISEAIKVGLIKDLHFYETIKKDAQKLAKRDMEAMQKLIHRCAELHVEHIGGADPFEFGSSRPLDFGHWAAHKLEQLTRYRLRHGEAVAIGIALDVVYSQLKGMIAETERDDVLALLQELDFALYVPELSQQGTSGKLAVIAGLREFREHLGGQLTIMLLRHIGVGEEVHEMDEQLVQEAIGFLQQKHEPQHISQV